MLLMTILVLPLLGGTAVALGRGRTWSAWAAVASNGGALALGIIAAVRVLREGPLSGARGTLRADALSVFMVIVIGAISLLASWLGVRTPARAPEDGTATPSGLRSTACSFRPSWAS